MRKVSLCPPVSFDYGNRSNTPKDPCSRHQDLARVCLVVGRPGCDPSRHHLPSGTLAGRRCGSLGAPGSGRGAATEHSSAGRGRTGIGRRDVDIAGHGGLARWAQPASLRRSSRGIPRRSPGGEPGRTGVSGNAAPGRGGLKRPELAHPVCPLGSYRRHEQYWLTG